MTFGHLTHTLSSNTVWDVRVGRFGYSREDESSTGDRTTPNRFDRITGISSGNVPQMGGLTLNRVTAKAVLNRYQPGLLGGDHQLRVGTEVERGEHRQPAVIPGGVRFVDSSGQPFQAVYRGPSMAGGRFNTNSTAARRFLLTNPEDYSRGRVLGSSPRLMRGSTTHPGVTSTTTMAFDAATGGRWLRWTPAARRSGRTCRWNVVSPRRSSARMAAGRRGSLHSEEWQQLHRLDGRGRASCSSRAGHAGSHRSHCSTCACRGRSDSERGVSSCYWTC